MLFTKSKDEITFEDVKTFCEYHAEDEDVEYKQLIVHVGYEQQITKNIPKVIASFANTYGGICLIGVEANQVDNRVTDIISVFIELSRQLFWAFDLPDRVSKSEELLSLIEGWYSQL